MDIEGILGSTAWCVSVETIQLSKCLNREFRVSHLSYRILHSQAHRPFSCSTYPSIPPSLYHKYSTGQPNAPAQGMCHSELWKYLERLKLVW